MSYSQEIYDAVRSKIHGGDVGSAVDRAIRDCFDISFAVDIVKQEYINAAFEQQRPSVLFKPALMVDGDQWCALLGDNLQEGVAGFGDTPAKAMWAFDEAFNKGQTPRAIQAARATGAQS